MQTFLSHDSDSGELRLVMADLWDGQHERTEFRVLGSDGETVRRGQEYDGLPARRTPAGGYYVKVGTFGHERHFAIEQRAVETVKTPCRRLASKSGRAKCALCAS